MGIHSLLLVLEYTVVDIMEEICGLAIGDNY
jgi:hypothetical protein